MQSFVKNAEYKFQWKPFITRFPLCQSHYARTKNDEHKYFARVAIQVIMYNLYIFDGTNRENISHFQAHL